MQSHWDIPFDQLFRPGGHHVPIHFPFFGPLAGRSVHPQWLCCYASTDGTFASGRDRWYEP